MKYGELIVHDALELGICRCHIEVNLKKNLSQVSKSTGWKHSLSK